MFLAKFFLDCKFTISAGTSRATVDLSYINFLNFL